MGLHVARLEALTSAAPVVLFRPRHDRRSYGRAAARAAIANGMLPCELSEVLGGRSVVDAFPVGGYETVTDYAERAVAEMMVAYLSQPFP